MAVSTVFPSSTRYHTLTSLLLHGIMGCWYCMKGSRSVYAVRTATTAAAAAASQPVTAGETININSISHTKTKLLPRAHLQASVSFPAPPRPAPS